jgi:UDP-2,4-diacetamido-2,4,6-trideoxy-beta-L-altropyranose hydrolase
MKKIIFRADGNSTTGLGHLYRIFALVEMLKDNFEYILLTSQTSTLQAIPAHYHLHTIPESVSTEEEPGWLDKNFPSSGYRIVADGYHFNSRYQEKLKKLNYNLVYIDDLTTEHMYADTVINHSLAVKISDYKTEPHTKLFLGTHYSLLRPAFLEAAKHSRKVDKINSAFVCFGGADEFDLTLTATKALLNFEEIKKINIVVGGAYLHRDIFELTQTHQDLNIYQNIGENKLFEVMMTCNFAIAPASTILYELCTVKMPLLSGYCVANQKNIYKGCVENNIIFDGGDFKNYTTKDFIDKITNILAQPSYQKYIDSQANLFDSAIKQRFLNIMLSLTYRRAVAADMLLLYNWANDKLSRANSYFSEPISLETHKKWFEKKLTEKNVLIYIAEVDNKPAGMVRYEVSDENAVVGILVGEDFRGRGLAAGFLRDTARLYFQENNKPVVAFIKKDNTASVRSFEYANYKKIKGEIVNGFASFVYQLEKEHV